MEVVVKKPKKGSLEYTLEVTFAPQGIEQKIQKKLVELSKKVKIAGFRPGKVPLHVIQEKYADETKWDIVQEEVQEAYRQALIQENLTPAATGTFEKMDYDNLEKLSFTAVVETMPNIEELKLEKLKLERYIPLINDEEVDEQVKKYQNYNRKWESKIVGSPAEESDQVIIDFEGRLEDGSTFDGNSATDFPVVLGDKQMLPEFEQALYGTAEGEQKNVSFTFPKGYGEKTLSEKNATFTITVKAVNKALLPELDDPEFLKNLGVTEGGVEQLKSLARMECSLQLEQTLNSFNNKLVQDVLLDSQKFIVPTSHIEEEKKILTDEAEKQHQQSSSGKISPLSKEELVNIDKQAYNRCKISLIYQQISKQYEIKPDTKAIANHLQQLCQQYFNGDFKAFEQSPQLPQVRRELEQRNVIEQIHNTVYEHAKVKEIQKHKGELEALSKKIFS